MKNKRIFLLFILSAIILFATANASKASDSISVGTDSFDTFEFTTKIERWTPVNELVYVQVDSWSGSWYTKTAYLKGTIDGTETEVELTNFVYDSNYGENVCYLGTSDPTSSYAFNFDYGSTVYLIERYDVSDIVNDTEFLVGTIDSNYILESNDYLDFTFDDSTVKDASMADYNKKDNNSFSKQLFVEARYQSETPSQENRDKYIYVYMSSNTDSKTDTDTVGTVQLPIFNLYVDFSASGNMMPAGHFRVSDLPSVGWGQNDSGARSGYGYYTGYVARNDNYSLLRYDDVNTSKLVEYTWSSDEHAVTSSGASSLQETVTSSLDDYSSNIYRYKLSTSFSSNRSAPNGVFYNIIPFAVAAVVAVAGIIILKKHSVK